MVSGHVTDRGHVIAVALQWQDVITFASLRVRVDPAVGANAPPGSGVHVVSAGQYGGRAKP
eukprot:759477-Rhodomonas_salina.2